MLGPWLCTAGTLSYVVIIKHEALYITFADCGFLLFNVCFLYCTSAGVGRTGTFITLDAQLKRIRKEQTIDVFGFVRSMRRRRCYMVQTEVRHYYILCTMYRLPPCCIYDSMSSHAIIYLKQMHTLQPQYIFTHDALLEAIECGVTEVAARDLQNQFQLLVDVNPVSGKTELEKWFQVRAEQPIVIVMLT